MTKEEYMLSRKRAAAAFYTDGPDIGDAPEADWVAAQTAWVSALAKSSLDTKRTAKAKKAHEDLQARASAAGLSLVSQEEMVQEYDKDLAMWRERAERAEAEVATLKGAR